MTVSSSFRFVGGVEWYAEMSVAQLRSILDTGPTEARNAGSFRLVDSDRWVLRAVHVLVVRCRWYSHFGGKF